MTTKQLIEKHRETTLQNDMQAQIEAGSGRKVVRWNTALSALKKAKHSQVGRVEHLQVLMQSDPAHGVVGLIEGIQRANKVAFARLQVNWQEAVQKNDSHAGKVPSTEDLAQAAAEKVARLWEAGLADPVKTRGYKIAMAYGGNHVWEACSSIFGPDPRTLGPEDLPGWPQGLPPAPFRVVHNEEMLPFLDLEIPGWVEDGLRGNAVRQAELLRKVAPANAYTWVREFAVETPGGREERADFTLFVHGLPILWVEMKIPERGVEAAAEDFLTKQTYQTAPLRLLVDSQQAILTAASEGTLEKWYVEASPIGHGAGMPLNGEEPGIKGGQAYLVGQILTHPERLEFLIRRASAFNDQGLLIVARSQQYEALANWWRDLLWSACSGQDITDRLIRHTQRTGKTHTMLRAIRLALINRGHFPSAFDMALLMVGETTIIDQIARTFQGKNTGLLDTSVAVNHADSRKAFRKAMSDQHATPGTKRVVLANTQKLDSLEHMNKERLGQVLTETGVKANGSKIRSLVVLDEGHLSQHGGMADMRRLLLPQARHLLLTATPKEAMARYYGLDSQDQTLGNFSYHQAIQAGIVVPVRYERYDSSLQVDHTRLDALARELGKPTLTPDALAMIDGDDSTPESLVHDRKERQALVRAVMEYLDNELLPGRLEAVVNKLDAIESTLLDDQGVALFKPKAMVFCRNTEQAKRTIKLIQQLNLAAAEGEQLPDHQLNMFQGRRFGMDVSNPGHGDDSLLKKLNPGVADRKAIKERFESEDEATRIDILLVVGKYTKGYDNPELCLVGLMKHIKEPSLINQIYTRPATKRLGKASGICLDLTLGTANIESWKASLDLYDSQSAEHFYDATGVAALVENIRVGLTGAAQAIDPNWTEHNLEDSTTLGWAIDQVKNGGLIQANRFVGAMSQVCETIEKLPDAGVLHPLRMPLLGSKYILAHVRRIFPELNTAAAPATSKSIHVIKPETLGQKIDNALRILQMPSLSHFLNLTSLGIREVDGLSVGAGASQAVAAQRTQMAIQNSIAAAKAILGATGEQADSRSGNDEQEDNQDPTAALRRALEVALERLMGMTQGDASNLMEADKRQKAEQAVAAVQAELQKLRAQYGEGDFSLLLTQALNEAFDARWTQLELPGAGRDLFAPLLRVAGQEWGRDFLAWRERNGSHVRAIDPTALVKLWIESEHAHNTSVVRWIPVCAERNPSWQARFTEWANEHRELNHLVRAAMGGGEVVETRGMPALLNEAAQEAGQKLALIEASLAWHEVAARDEP